MHEPVLTEKVLEYLDPQPNENFIDCTAGGGGHTFAIAERIAPKGKILALDWDAEAIQSFTEELRKRRLQNRVFAENENFANIKEAAAKNAFRPVAGILFDLGLSSDQLESRRRGFTFRKEEPLDMRYNTQNPITAEKLLNYSSKIQLERMLRDYSEKQFSKPRPNGISEEKSTLPRKHFKRFALR